MQNRLPAYPLITIDPFCSIWSKGDILNKSETMLWNGISKNLLGIIKVDGREKRFLGFHNYDVEAFMWQPGRDILPLESKYSMECGEVKINVNFWSPMIPEDIYMLSLPVGYIDYEVVSTDGKDHDVEVHFMIHENFCSNTPSEKVYKSFGSYGVLYNKEQKPLAYSGDGVEADWGKYYVFGDNVNTRSDSYYRLDSVHAGKVSAKKSFKAFDVFAYDDIYSIEYMGKKLKCIWTEKYKNIIELCLYCRKNHNSIYKKAVSFQNKLLKDAEPFGDNYVITLCASLRHVLAGHKLIRNDKGELLYFSKECFSNGCINTVDVTFPSTPLFFIYNPKLIPAMMNGIFEFAEKPVWKYDFSPHDLGIYPLADGQIYGSYRISKENHRTIYKWSPKLVTYIDEDQMPVENSGNMIIMTYAYYLLTGDKAYVKKHFSMLNKWADYLVKYGDSKELQLCTDDFAGKYKGNINLAIKAAVALKAFGEISAVLGKTGDIYFDEATKKAQMIIKDGNDGDHLMLAFGKKDSWSLKYNLIWDKIFGFNLFPKSVYTKETECYKSNMNKYGVTLNSERNITKSDWEMWVSAFDSSGIMTGLISEKLVAFLHDTFDRVPFSDFYFPATSEWTQQMCHRTVQGGLWMPVLVKKFSSLRKV